MASMIQQVDLYQPVFKKASVPFAANTLYVLVLLIAVLLLLVTASSMWQLDGLRQQAVQLDLQKQQLQQQLTEVKNKLKPAPGNHLLQSKKTQLLNDMRNARGLVSLLESEIDIDSKAFSGYLRGLAETRIDGLWLSRLQIGHNGESLSISGNTLRPELLPQLLQSLRQQAIFQGQNFESVEMGRPAVEGVEQPLMFHMETTREDADEKRAG